MFKASEHQRENSLSSQPITTDMFKGHSCS